jgi:hypothetical protein
MVAPRYTGMLDGGWRTRSPSIPQSTRELRIRRTGACVVMVGAELAHLAVQLPHSTVALGSELAGGNQ